MIKKLLDNPRLVIFNWSIFISYPLLAYIRYKLFVLNHYKFIFGEVFWRIILLIPYITGFFCIGILVYWLFKKVNRSLNEKQNKALNYVAISSLIYFIFGRVIIFIENLKYSNYIYSGTGIDIGRLDLATSIAWFVIITIFAIELILNERINQIIYPKPIAAKSKMTLFLLCYALLILISLSAYSLVNANVYYQIALSKYEDKYGGQIKYLETIKKYVPENGWVIHPPRNLKWAAVGNQSVVRYFIFPRTLVDGFLLKEQSYAEQFNNAFFQEIELGRDDTHWPLINIKKSEIIFDEKNPIKYKNLTLIYEDSSSKIYQIIFK